MNSRLKILISAYACNPTRGSEHAVGWNWVQMIAQRHEAWVLTAEFQRAAIEHELVGASSPALRPRFCYVRARPWHYRPGRFWRRIEHSALKPLVNWMDSRWLREAYRLASRLHRQERFDLAHQLTYVGFRFPGWLWQLGIPFVWGPIGGLENTPWRCLPMFGIRGACYYGARNLVNSAQKAWLQNPRRAFRHARGGIIAATAGIRDEITRCYGEISEVICEVGPVAEIADSPKPRPASSALRIAWSAEHLPGKALPLLLQALHLVANDLPWQLEILGDGPCTPAWRALTDRLGLRGRCHWHGWRPRVEALEQVRLSHLFVITSLKDLTSAVLLEALSLGLPVIALDHCGFREVLTEACGIKIAVGTPRQIARDIAAGIRRLGLDESVRLRLAAGALARAQEYAWEKKTEALESVYNRVMHAQPLRMGLPCELGDPLSTDTPI